MTNHQAKYQPGPIFNDVFLGALRAMGSSTRAFATEIDVPFQSLRGAATGHQNGPKAQSVRNSMIEYVGPDLFATIYRARMERETAGTQREEAQ